MEVTNKIDEQMCEARQLSPIRCQTPSAVFAGKLLETRQ
jgi:hypothetical protein